MSYFEAKKHQNRFRLRLRPTPLGELTALHKPPSWNRGDLLLKEGEGCREGKRGANEGREGKEGEGKGRERRGPPYVFLNFP